MNVRARLLGSLSLAAVLSCAATPRPAPAAPPASGAKPANAPAVDPEQAKQTVAAYIHSHLSKLQACYVSSLETTPALEGKMALEVTVDADGVPRDVVVESD